MKDLKKKISCCPKCKAIDKIRKRFAGFFEGDVMIAYCDSGLGGCGWHGYEKDLITKEI